MAYRPTPRTEANRLRQRDAIINTAQQCVLRGGFAALSIVGVATGAGVATGTVYRHFASKAELCAEVFRRATQKEIDVLMEITRKDTPAQQRLVDLITAFCQRAMRGRIQAYALIAEPVDPLVETERLHYRSTYTQLFGELIDAGIKAGEIPAQHTPVSAAALVGALAETLVGPLAMHLQKDTDFNSDEESELIHHISRFCLRAITCKEPAP